MGCLADASRVIWLTATLAALACVQDRRAPDPGAALITLGEELFFNEAFAGNGRTCGTCHRAEESFGLSPALIATLPDSDPLFVAERDAALARNFENPRLMRELGLILENLDGFDDLDNQFVMRGVPHTLALRTSVASPTGARLGWSGDGSPGDGSLRSFAVGAVIQHFTKTTDRVAGVDFRLPTEAELDALEAFQLSLGRQQDLELPLPLKGSLALRGQEIFLDDTVGKCNLCHNNAGAIAKINGQDLGNASFDTGVEDLPDQPADLTGERVPRDDGFGRPGDGSFNTPPLVEAADTGPFFHNNAVATLEAAIGFYDGDAFNESPAGQLLKGLDPEGAGIEIDATQISALAAFLRVINALENIRQSIALLEDSLQPCADTFTAPSSSAPRQQGSRRERLRRRALAEIDDAARVLAEADLHLDGVVDLERARDLTRKAMRSIFGGARSTRLAVHALERVRGRLIESPRVGSAAS